MTPVEPPTTEFVFEAQVSCGEPLRIGPSAHGQRQLIPITGGAFKGPKLSGKVLPGGADWQLVRPDGVREIEARYTIQTDDGALIGVRNIGLAANNEGAPPYVRTAPQFEAPSGPHEWLNKRLFVGTLSVASREPLVVTVRVFLVK